MSDDKSKSLDILGLHPLASAAKQVVAASVDGASALLSRICLPAAEELGLLFRDKVKSWRTVNLAKILVKTEDKLRKLNIYTDAHASPRIVLKIVQEGSLIDDERMQDMWAGLLASSCSPDQSNDSNLIFIDLLSKLTRLQAVFLAHVCDEGALEFAKNGLFTPGYVYADLARLKELTGENDIHRLDRELDHLNSLDLIRGGFNPLDGPSIGAHVQPTALGLHLYMRCQGFRGSAPEFAQLINESKQGQK